jgi:hypothetical protein
LTRLPVGIGRMALFVALWANSFEQARPAVAFTWKQAIDVMK